MTNKPKWLVTTVVTMRRTYEVEGSNPKEAEANSCDATPTLEEDVNEQTESIVPLTEAVP
jgi:hypothetical protein